MKNIIGRTFGIYTKELPPDIELINKIENSSFDVIEERSKEVERSIRAEKNVDFFGELDYPCGLIELKILKEYKRPYIQDNQIRYEDDKKVEKKEIPFWIWRDENIIMLKSSKGFSKKYGISAISKAIFDDSEEIKPVMFDLEKIHDHYDKKDRVEGRGFRNREGGYHSGNVYGEAEETDPLKSEIDEATQTWVSFNHLHQGNIHYITVYRSGTITIAENWYAHDFVPRIFKISKGFIEDFSKNDY